MIQKSVEQQWYGSPHWLLLFAPLSFVFRFLSRWRRRRLSAQQAQLPLPVIVIGNIAVGGTGKTPFIVALSLQLKKAGLRPGIIARGYGSDVQGNVLVNETASAAAVGDEPLFLTRVTGCPVVVGQDRVKSVAFLAQNTNCDLVLSDDGLQHYRLARQIEIVLLDGSRGIGNGWSLPVGPLREPPSRLMEADWVFINGNLDDAMQSFIPLPKGRTHYLQLAPQMWRNLKTGERISPRELSVAGEACAIAGIGNPQRFFNQLRELGFTGDVTSFADHHAYTSDDLKRFSDKRLLMTEKDAVKCQDFAGEDWWALEVAFTLPGDFIDALLTQLKPGKELFSRANKVHY